MVSKSTKLAKASIESLRRTATRHTPAGVRRAARRLGAFYRRDDGCAGGGDPCHILIIDGSEPTNMLSRYRIKHMREQLESNGLSTSEVPLEDFKLEDESFAKTLVLHKCPLTPVLHESIIRAHGNGKKVFYDVDDLCVSDSLVDRLASIKPMRVRDIIHLEEGIRRRKDALVLCDGAIVANKALACSLSSILPKYFVNGCVASEEMINASTIFAKGRGPFNSGSAVIAYRAHGREGSEALASNAPMLCKVLQRFQQSRLLILGKCGLPKELEQFQERIDIVSNADWYSRPEIMASIDVGLIFQSGMIADNNNEVDWVDYALAGAAIVASSDAALGALIDDGASGCLCSGEANWLQSLDELIRDQEMRNNLGSKARARCCASRAAVVAGVKLAEELRPAPRSIRDVFPDDGDGLDEVSAFLEARGFRLFSREFSPKPWNSVSTSSRLARLDASISSNRKVAILLYDRECGDDATFRYYGYNVAEHLGASSVWDAVYFFLDEFDELISRLSAIQLVVCIRMRIRPEVVHFINCAHAVHVPVAYCIDDNALGLHMAERMAQGMCIDKASDIERDFWYGVAVRFEQAASLCDCFIASTDRLAEVLSDRYAKPTFAIRASLNRLQVEIAKTIQEETGQRADHRFAIGYFSGTTSHDADFSIVKPALMSLLAKHDDVCVVLVGDLKLDEELVLLWREGRVVLLPRVDYVTLLYLQSAVDVALAPLVLDEFTDCKSALKVFESGLVGTPTCAAPSHAYIQSINQGKTGFVCADGEEWIRALEMSMNDGNAEKMGRAAQAFSLKSYYGDAVRSIVEIAFSKAATVPLSRNYPDGQSILLGAVKDWSNEFEANVVYGKHAREEAGASKAPLFRMPGVIRRAAFMAEREGVAPTLRRTIDYTRGLGFDALRDMRNPAKPTFYDVLFINGCSYSLPHPIRYRVDHQIEQLKSNGLQVDRIDSWDLSIEDVSRARAFVIFRCPYTSELGDFIAMAHRLNKIVYFDIDDLVVDRKYTDTIKYLDTMSDFERAGYDDGVDGMGRTLKECGRAITTTERLAEELETIVPEVVINRNTASEQMLRYSNQAVYERDVLPFLDEERVLPEEKAHWRWAKDRHGKREGNGVVIGYFSGSITHNDDFAMVLTALVDVLGMRPEVKLYIAGLLDIPTELMPYSNRVFTSEFVSWERLPEAIAAVDINIAPLELSVFNAAKSENKWVEAALVKVPTVASKVGAFARMIDDGKTGLLCETPDDWREKLLYLVDNPEERKKIGSAAYEICLENCTTIKAGYSLARYLRTEFNPNVFMVLPSLKTSGGVVVALKHCAILQRAGYDVTIVDFAPEEERFTEAFVDADGCLVPVIHGFDKRNRDDQVLLLGSVDQMIGTMWTTTILLDMCTNVKSKKYLVQNFETDFYEPPHPLRIKANATYARSEIEFLTISQWCKDWLGVHFCQTARYAPNGIDVGRFPYKPRDFTDGKKVRILIEGDSDSYYKNVDEAFDIVNRLDFSKYEIWYMSYNASPKPNYHVDRFLHDVSHDEVGQVYAACDILLKTSILESFSYPPLEMMATGGFVVAIPNGGNREYLEHGNNCLLFESGDFASAIACIELIVEERPLRDTLLRGGFETVLSRDWKTVELAVLALYS